MSDIEIPEHIKRETRRKLEKREQLFEQNISCPKCESKDLQTFVWSPAHAGALRNVSCRDCREFFNVFWNTEDEECHIISSDLARGLAG